MSVAAPPRRLRSSAIRAALGLEGPPAVEREYRGVSSDSRTLEPGQLFVALQGERHDAADFLPQAADRGAPGAIIPAGREDPTLPLEYFGVPDPLTALGALATSVRRTAPVTVIAITGSSGKTTVKEMVACALAETRQVYRTEGNLNSQVGLPLTILRAPEEADTWVLEVGASEPGEIARLTRIAAPDHVIITTVGSAHLERFGSVERVLEEKLDLARGASPDGVLVVGEVPDALVDAAARLRPDAIVAGLGQRATYRPDSHAVLADSVEFTRAGARMRVAAGGEHHLRDALLAAAVAEALGVHPRDIASGLARFRPLGMRGALREVGGLTVLVDCYNANPDSFRAAIAQCRDLFPDRRRAAFVGSMLELGDHAERSHREVVRLLVESGFELIAATGLFAATPPPGVNGVEIVLAAKPEDAWASFAERLEGDEVVLLKASRGARLEFVLERLEARFGAGS